MKALFTWCKFGIVYGKGYCIFFPLYSCLLLNGFFHANKLQHNNYYYYYYYYYHY